MRRSRPPRPEDPLPPGGSTELAVAVLGYVALAVRVALGATGRPPDMALAVAAVGVATLGAVGLALVVRVRSLAPLRLRLPGRRWLLVGLAAGAAMRLVTFGVALVWTHLTGDRTNPQQAFVDGAVAGGWMFLGLVVFGGLVVPFAEELFFRGVVYSALRRYGAVLATLASAALFGIAHGVSVVLVIAFLLGVRQRRAGRALRLDLARGARPRHEQHDRARPGLPAGLSCPGDAVGR